MILIGIGFFLGSIATMTLIYVGWSFTANRNEATGPLPLMPPPAAPIPADTLVGYQPRHRKERVR